MKLLTWVLVFIGYCGNKPPPPGVTNNVLGKALKYRRGSNRIFSSRHSRKPQARYCVRASL